MTLVDLAPAEQKIIRRNVRAFLAEMSKRRRGMTAPAPRCIQLTEADHLHAASRRTALLQPEPELLAPDPELAAARERVAAECQYRMTHSRTVKDADVPDYPEVAAVMVGHDWLHVAAVMTLMADAGRPTSVNTVKRRLLAAVGAGLVERCGTTGVTVMYRAVRATEDGTP